MSYRGKKRKNKTSTVLKVIVVILSLILLFLVVFAGGLTYLLSKLGHIEPTETIPPEQQVFEVEEETEEGLTLPPEVEAEEIVWDEISDLYNKDIINILLIGQDRREEEGDIRARSDSMIVVSMNTEKKTLQMTSFMRDLYVQIPGGYADNRINASYTMGGPDLLKQTLNKNFGISIDGTVEVDFNQFQAIVEILGGVDVEMNQEESNYMNNSEYDAGPTNPGMNHLNGYQALIFARMRKISGNDFGRTERQRRLLKSVANSLKSASLEQINLLVDVTLPFVTTDMTDDQVVNYALAASMIIAGGSELQTGRIPADDAYYDATINGMMVLVPDLEKCQDYLRDFIYSE